MLFIMLCYYVVIIISYYSPLFGTSETTPGVLHLVLTVSVKKEDQKSREVTWGLDPPVCDILERVWRRATRLVRDLENKSYA